MILFYVYYWTECCFFFFFVLFFPAYSLFLFANLKSLLYSSLSLMIHIYSLDLNDLDNNVYYSLKKKFPLPLGKKNHFLPTLLHSNKMRFYKPTSILLPFFFFLALKRCCNLFTASLVTISPRLDR